MVAIENSRAGNDHSQKDLEGPGVLIRTIRQGDMNLPRAKHGDTVRVHLEAFLEDRTRINNTRNRYLLLEFEIGTHQVIEGLEVALQHMDVGSLCEVTIPSCYAYKDIGLPPQIPPNAVLIYHIELIGIVPH